MSEESLSGTHITIRINKPANLCVVVSRIEVVEARFGIVVVTAIAERVVRAEGGRESACDGKNVAPRVVGIFDNDLARGGQNCENIASEVLAEIVIFAAVSNAENAAVFVIEIRLNGSVSVFAYYLRAVELVSRSYSVDGLRGSNSVFVIVVRSGCLPVCERGKLSAVFLCRGEAETSPRDCVKLFHEMLFLADFHISCIVFRKISFSPLFISCTNMFKI